MLRELRIHNFAIIEEMHVCLEDGLNVLTGETGAGKSIVIDALGFVLGGRAGVGVVRHGAKSARVEALFSLPNDLDRLERVRRLLDAAGIEVDGEALTLSREQTAAGRGTYRVDGVLVTQTVLRSLADVLVEVHGQGQAYGLQSAGEQLALLDMHGGEALLSCRARYRALWERWKALRAERDELRGEQLDRQRRSDWLRFEIEEIDQLALVKEPDECETLQAERFVLVHADKIAMLLGQAAALLDGAEGGGEGEGIVSACGQVTRLLSSVHAVDGSLADMVQAAQNINVVLSELRREMGRYLDGLNADPQRLEQVNERLSAIERLRKKYGATVRDILDYAENARSQLEQLDTSEGRLTALQDELKACECELHEAGALLSRARRDAAARFERDVADELTGLEMPGAIVQIRFSWQEDATGIEVSHEACALVSEALSSTSAPPQRVCIAAGSQGFDRIEMLISANPGQPLQPLAKVASGGEMSRVMLAIVSVLAQIHPVSCMVFDEVDAGLGGIAAQAVATRLRKIARARQVLCVTHLPLVAAAADCHWMVAKASTSNHTDARSRCLSHAERVVEIARMLAGRAATDTTIRQAEELLSARPSIPHQENPNLASEPVLGSPTYRKSRSSGKSNRTPI